MNVSYSACMMRFKTAERILSSGAEEDACFYKYYIKKDLTYSFTRERNSRANIVIMLTLSCERAAG